ncbi:MAG: sulfurtransferase TusA family protein [Asgard group archaeon]|nr:sulfurtransferase TusA family protein [Asgard group archaeon]
MSDESSSIIKIDCIGETCPIPLVETRKAIRKASPGDVIEIIGDHSSSKKEIPMAVEALGLELLSIEEEGKKWKIRIKIPKEKK